MRQLSLLSNNPQKSYKIQDYLLSENNMGVYQKLIVENWSCHCTILYGNPGTGKSHLTHVWQQVNNALFLYSLSEINIIEENRCYIIEDIHKIVDESRLLHLYNLTKECNSRLLLTTRVLPKLLSYKLPDLRSRILASLVLKLPKENESLLRVILLKEFSIRQIKISKEIINYIINRTERSLLMLFEIVKIIDQASLEAKRNITIPFIRNVLSSQKIRIAPK